MFKRNDPGFKSLVDATLVDLMQRGELARIYERWFVAPIPPSGRSLELPMSELLKQRMGTEPQPAKAAAPEAGASDGSDFV